MRSVTRFAATLLLASAPVLSRAQTPPVVQPNYQVKHHPREGVERPVDKGPYTPEANKAYQGGGVVLQGAPGGPAPTPQATPPGQPPAHSVPQ